MEPPLLVYYKEEPVKLFLLGGQSNMDGCGRWIELPEKLNRTPANVRIWDNRTQEWKKIGEVIITRSRNIAGSGFLGVSGC